jgi:hypothetical protein
MVDIAFSLVGVAVKDKKFKLLMCLQAAVLVNNTKGETMSLK